MLLEWVEIQSLLPTCGELISTGRTLLHVNGGESKQGTCNWHHTSSKIAIDIDIKGRLLYRYRQFTFPKS